jgi:hypothetical protein
VAAWVPSESLLLSGPSGCSPRRRLPGGASSRSRAVGRRRGRPCQQARHGVGRRCPACGVHPSGLGVRDPAVQPSGVRSPGVVVQRVRRSAVCCPPVCCPAVRCPAVRPDAFVSSHAQAVAVGPRSSWPGDPDHQHWWRSRWLPGRRRLDDGRGGRDAGDAAQLALVNGRSVADPGCRLGAGRPGRGPLSDQAGQAGDRGAPRGRRRCGHGCRRQREVAAPAAWRPSWAGGATTVSGRRRA